MPGAMGAKGSGRANEVKAEPWAMRKRQPCQDPGEHILCGAVESTKGLRSRRSLWLENSDGGAEWPKRDQRVIRDR